MNPETMLSKALGRLAVAVLLACATAWGQPSGDRRPHLGYLYPAGGQQGAVFRVLAGGQYLRGARDVFVYGEGVNASIIKVYRPLRNLDADQRRELQRRLRARWEEVGGGQAFPLGPGLMSGGKGKAKSDVAENSEPSTKPLIPEHPLLENIDTMTMKELVYVADQTRQIKKKQMNAQIGEMALLEVTIEPGAGPGDRELRLLTAAGLTNPMLFRVGTLPEAREQEPNEPNPVFSFLPEDPPLDLPVLLNGQILPGDIDRFRINARKGQDLVLAVEARKLVPYLADAVPGWFQATIALYGPDGQEVAYSDDFRFSPDPVLFYRAPEDGVYVVEIRDSIYRGREDFVYRVAVGELPFVTQAYPLGGRVGAETVAALAGHNLGMDRLTLDTRPGPDPIRFASMRAGDLTTNAVAYAVADWAESNETEPNNNLDEAQSVETPVTVNGRIDKAGDVDVFRFEGKAGQEIVAEVLARRLNSPLDSLLRLTDAAGTVLEWNDDQEDKEFGLVTHHADSYLRVRLPQDGSYCVELSDQQRQGGDAFAYRLSLTPPRPDFALRVTPSTVNAAPGRAVPVCVHALRRDGFDGEIAVALKDAPPGFILVGGRIPKGKDSIRMTLAVPRRPVDEPVSLRFEGSALIDGETVSRPVVPAEDMMQAFIYRHLTPSREFLVSVRGGRRPGPPVELADSGPVQIPAGGTAQVRVLTPPNPKLKDIQFELREPPDGITLGDTQVEPDGLSFSIKAAAETLEPGFEDNLIVEAFLPPPPPAKDAKRPKSPQRVSAGVLPAISIEITAPPSL